MRCGLFLIFALSLPGMSKAQYSERMTRSRYFDTYKEIAILEMQRSGVPASITLAQGALESADGNSRLARNGNNHFGIKCHNDWNGKKIFEDDDTKNECFRKYASVEDSYQDHSDYLRSKSRYAFLFELNSTDYKGWARGLKKAGYATNPGYAEALIRIIEENNLDIYDRVVLPRYERNEKRTEGIPVVTRPVLERNRVKYIVARPGDSFKSITREFGKLDRELPRYNDIPESDSLIPGQVIFIQPKRNKAEAGSREHVVKPGETMYTISQQYAVKLASLYAMNGLNPGDNIESGTVLQLRKSVKRPRQAEDDGSGISGEGEEIKIILNPD